MPRSLLTSSWLVLWKRAYPITKHFQHDRLRLKPDLALWQKNDAKRNEQTRPPDDEFIDLCCVWAVEFYTPSHISQLESAIRRLGWDNDDATDSLDSAIAMLRRSRLHQWGGAWKRLDKIGRPISNAVSSHGQEGLPHETKLASCYLVSLSPSLIAIVACFGFPRESEYASIFDRALRTDRATYTTPTESGFQVYDPWLQKIESVKQARAELCSLAEEWFSRNIPGLYSSGLLDREMPTFELITLRNAEPYPTRLKDSDVPSSYLQIINMEHGFEAWSSTIVPGLKVSFPRLRRDRPRYHATLAIKEGDLVDAVPSESWGREDRWGRTMYVDFWLSKAFCGWSIMPMIEGYTRQINSILGSSALSQEDRNGATEVLAKLQNYLSFSSDVLAVSADLIEVAKHRHMWQESGDFFQYVESYGKSADDKSDDREKISMIEEFRSTVSSRASWIVSRDGSIRDHVTQFASVLGANENVRLQRKLGCLTWVLVLLTIVMAVTALLPLLSIFIPEQVRLPWIL